MKSKGLAGLLCPVINEIHQITFIGEGDGLHHPQCGSDSGAGLGFRGGGGQP